MTVAVIKQSVRLSEKAILPSGRDEPVIERLAGDLLVTYAFDLPDRFEFVARRHCEALGLAAGDLPALRAHRARRGAHARPGSSPASRPRRATAWRPMRVGRGLAERFLYLVRF